MSNEFEVKAVLDDEAFETFARIDSIFANRKFRRISFIASALLILIGALILLDFGLVPSAVVFIVIGLSILLSTLSSSVTNGARMKKAAKGVLEYDYRFSRDSFSYESRVEKVHEKYSDVATVYESKKFFFLIMASHRFHILPKRGFVLGSPENFCPFMKEVSPCEVVATKY